MDKKTVITILLVYITLNSMEGLEISHFWILNQLIKLVICLAVFSLFAFIWSSFTKEKF
jgi:hypothetical protein